METLEKLRTERLNLLLNFCNDKPPLARLSMPQIKQQLEQHEKEFYIEFTDNLLQLYGADLTSYVKSVLYSIRKVEIEGYSRSLKVWEGPDSFYKFRKQNSRNYSASYRYPVTHFFDPGMENSEKLARIQHMVKVLELIQQDLEEIGSFVSKSYRQAKKVNSDLVDEEIWISRNLEREQEGLWMELISLVKRPESLGNEPHHLREFKSHKTNVSLVLGCEIEDNYYMWEEGITRPYLQQMKALFIRQIDEINELVSYEKHSEIRTAVITTLNYLVGQVEKLQKNQIEEPFHESMESLLKGSDFERILIHLKKYFMWEPSPSPRHFSKNRLKESCSKLGIREGVLNKIIGILKTSPIEWPEDAKTILWHLEHYWSRELHISLWRPKSYKYGLQDIFRIKKPLSEI